MKKKEVLENRKTNLPRIVVHYKVKYKKEITEAALYCMDL
ncbi:hypothetical protein F383_03585 [Gossypium arboreum]|uniref:Uncharacterized protein n=1 Tax=Gossypium arboreum TaxID=29729 RepID=A0A0B0P9C1_GOSAR|nr:hypothetical protein F383_03585 [Gossypium arboreum]